MIEYFPWVSKGVFWVFLALGVSGVGVFNPFLVTAQQSDRRSGAEFGNWLLKKTVTHPDAYRARSRRDPFIPLPPVETPDDADVTQSADSATPLAGFTLLGIMSGKRGAQALLQLPNGERVMVGRGSHLKTIPGTVKRMTRDVVVIARPAGVKNGDQIVKDSLVFSP